MGRRFEGVLDMGLGNGNNGSRECCAGLGGNSVKLSP